VAAFVDEQALRDRSKPLGYAHGKGS